MTRKTPTRPQGLPVSITTEAEKLAALRTASYFDDHRGKADWEAFDRLMGREGGEAPRPGDEMPGA